MLSRLAPKSSFLYDISRAANGRFGLVLGHNLTEPAFLKAQPLELKCSKNRTKNYSYLKTENRFFSSVMSWNWTEPKIFKDKLW